VFRVSERRACRVVGQPRSVQRRKPVEDRTEKRLVGEMRLHARRHPRFGYRRVAALLRGNGWAVNDKRVHRLWRREGLKVVSVVPSPSCRQSVFA
jgi:transposase InsO family protein